MMAIYYHAQRGFMLPDVHDDIPENAQPITEAEYTDLLTGQADGRLIVPDGLGRPTLIDAPVPE